MSDLLEQKLEINDVCEQLIRKSKKQYAAITILFSIVTLIGLVSYVYRIYVVFQREFTSPRMSIYEMLFSFFMIAYLLISILQVYYYYRAISIQKRAVDITDQHKFETSFKYYVYGNKAAIGTLTLFLIIEFLPYVTDFINS